MTRLATNMWIAENGQLVHVLGAATRDTLESVNVPCTTLPALDGVLAAVCSELIAIGRLTGIAFVSEGKRGNERLEVEVGMQLICHTC